jgi:hypothetical protein
MAKGGEAKARPAAETEPPELSPEDLENLKTLGYAD